MLRPVVLLAVVAASNNQYSPSFPGGIVAWIVCSKRKRHEYGGWLLFFYWQLYSGIIMTAIFFWINFQSYVPENFDDPGRYHLFLVSSVPPIVLFALQTAVATIMISVRTWDLARLLRGLLVAQVVAACVSVLIDAKYFPDNIALDIMFTLIPESLWMGYFFGSKRVRHVFQAHDWDKAVEIIHPTGTTRLVI